MLNCAFHVGIDIYVSSDYASDSGWQLRGMTGLDQQIPIGNLATELANKFPKPTESSVVLPEPIRSLSLENLAISFNTKSKDFAVACDSQFTIDSESVVISVKITVVHQQNGSFEKHFEGKIAIGDLQFALIFDKDKTSQTFLAAYHDSAGNDIQVRDLVGHISSTLGNYIPSGLTISLKDALFAYQKKNAQTNFLFGLNIDGGINLSKLPLVGKVFPANQTIKLAIQILVTKADFSQTELTQLNTLYSEGGISLPEEGITSRLGIASSIRFGNTVEKLNLPVKVDNSSGHLTDTGDSSKPIAAGASGDKTKWFSLQKSFGPVHFDRLGVKYQEQKVWFLLDASLSAGGLTVALEGLSVDYFLTKFKPTFRLHGLSIDYQNQAVEIGGAFFLRKQVTPAQGDPHDEYDGTLVVKAEELTLSAIGSYAYLNDDNRKIDAIPWKDQGKLVVNIEQLATNIEQELDFTEFTSAQFALEAIEGVQMVKFRYQ